MKPSLLFLWLCLAALPLSAQTWQPLGPFGGLIRSAAIVDGSLLVGTNAGIYRSTDGGQTYSAWSQGLPAGDVIDLMQDGNKLYACVFEKGIYRSDDGGITWTQVLAGRYLRQDGFGQSKIQKVGTHLMVRNYDDFNDTLFFSSDAGATWTRRAIPGSLFNNIYGFGSTLFGYGDAGVFGPQAGLYRSDNLGQTWVFSGMGMPAGQYIGQMVSFGDTLYALSKHIFRSVNGGSSWTQATTDTLLTVGGAYAFFPEWFLKAGRTLYAQNGGNFNVKVAAWTPGQARWQDSYAGLPTQGTTLGLYFTGTKVLLGRYEGILYQTSGPGQPWTVASLQGINAIEHFDVFVQGNEALATTATTVRSGSDASGAWTVSNPANISNEVRIFSAIKSGSNYVLGVENVFGVLDLFQAASPAGPWTNKGIYDIAPNARLLATGDSLIVYGSLGGTPACFITNSQGVEISDFDTGLFGFSFDDGVPAMTVHKGDLYCIITGFVNGFSKIRKYDLPGGTNWVQVAEKIDNQFFGASALASWKNRLYLGMLNGGVNVSANDGTAWSDLSSGLNGAIVNQLYGFGDFLAAATDRGVFLLEDGDNTWTDLTFNLPVADIRKVQASGQYLWALTQGGGVWRLLREGNVAADPALAGPAAELFPCPAADLVTLRVETPAGYAWEIVDLQGRQLLAGKTLPGGGEVRIAVGHLPAGMYYCRVQTEHGHSAVPFIKP
jgi:photosystem II stability/assembly factor-like uncharacterized protein